ncbi:acyltransferase family protein [Sphingomonas sp. GB1N7]|uniref:acyltransferase family protein n=1 Tax=Parasphingomonas caseinilytica TaxID=3096158 RepID=UPI002FC8AF36
MGGGSDRHVWLDNARGIGIILVVYAHQMRAQALIGNIPGSWGGSPQDVLIYSFHMPLFFFISGIVSYRSLQSKASSEYFIDKLKTIAYPYILWSLISWCLSALAVRYVNRPMDFRSLIFIGYQPILQYWFLYILFLCQVLSLMLKKIFMMNISLACIFLVIPIASLNPTIKEFLMSFPFFVVGLVMSGLLLATTDGGLARWTIPVALFALMMFTGLTYVRLAGTVFPQWAALAQAWAGIAVVVMVSQCIGQRCSRLSALGRASMAIFVMHTIVAAAIRTSLAAVDLHHPAVMLVTCVAGGLIIPLIVFRAAARYGLEAWFGLGKPGRSQAAAGRATASAVP